MTNSRVALEQLSKRTLLCMTGRLVRELQESASRQIGPFWAPQLTDAEAPGVARNGGSVHSPSGGSNTFGNRRANGRHRGCVLITAAGIGGSIRA